MAVDCAEKLPTIYDGITCRKGRLRSGPAYTMPAVGATVKEIENEKSPIGRSVPLYIFIVGSGAAAGQRTLPTAATACNRQVWRIDGASFAGRGEWLLPRGRGHQKQRQH